MRRSYLAGKFVKAEAVRWQRYEVWRVEAKRALYLGSGPINFADLDRPDPR